MCSFSCSSCCSCCCCFCCCKGEEVEEDDDEGGVINVGRGRSGAFSSGEFVDLGVAGAGTDSDCISKVAVVVTVDETCGGGGDEDGDDPVERSAASRTVAVLGAVVVTAGATGKEGGATNVPVTATVPSVASVMTVVTLEGLVPVTGVTMTVGMDLRAVGVEIGVVIASMHREVSGRIWSSFERSGVCIKGARIFSEDKLVVMSSFADIFGE